MTVVAEHTGVEQDEPEPLYRWADHLYSSPPPAEAQGIVEFSYEGFRVTLERHAVLMNRSTSE